MALINCPECGQEVSDLAPACIHCGCPLNEQPPNIQEKKTAPCYQVIEFIKQHKAIFVIAVIALILLTLYFALFHLNQEEIYAYELMIANADSFKNPKEATVLSGCAGWDNDSAEAYAFLRISAPNSYGATVSGYYCLHPDAISDVSGYDSMISLCNQNDVNASKINRRLWLYWIFN